MKVYIRNKLITIGGSSEVLNENKEPIYKIKGKWISPNKKKLMYDMQGNLLYTIRNRFFNWLHNKVFVYDANGDKVATIVKNKWSINRNYRIEDTIDEMSIEGKFIGLTSKILKNGEEIGVITRQITFMEDAFSLEAEPQDIQFLIALVIAFDNIIDKRREDND